MARVHSPRVDTSRNGERMMVAERTLLTLTAAALTVFGACAQRDESTQGSADSDTLASVSSASRESDEEALRELDRKLQEAFSAKDPNAVGSFYAEDAVLMPPGATVMNGRPAVSGYWTEAFKMPNLSLAITPGEVVVAQARDLAYETGTYEFSGDTEQGHIEDEGKYVVVWRRASGGWQIAVDIWNSDRSPVS